MSRPGDHESEAVPRPTTYWDYIRVEELLRLQSGLASDEGELTNEEVVFVTVHQVFELWFKLILRDLRSARDLFVGGIVAEQELSRAAERLSRMVTIFRVAVQHFEVVETIGTREYLEFRRKLMPASGFQSAQLRQIEILFGLSEDERLPLGAPGSHLRALERPGGGTSSASERVEAALRDTPTLKEAIESWLLRTPIGGVLHDHPEADQRFEEFRSGFIAAHTQSLAGDRAHARAVATSDAESAHVDRLYDRESAAVRAFLHPTEEEGGARRARVRAAMLFIETHRELPLLAWPRQVLTGLLELEQAFLIFRQRHARMVERVIGRRTGTGGSAGVEYLDKTALEYRIFKDLWAIRTVLLAPSAVPPAANAEFYGFRVS